MKRKDGNVPKDDARPASDESSALSNASPAATTFGQVFILEEGRLKPFAQEQYTVSTLYEITESFDVECRLVKPEDPGHLLYEGKKPSRKTLPVIISNSGESVFLDSWENLEANPAQLADAAEVFGVTPMKQVFVLKRRNAG